MSKLLSIMIIGSLLALVPFFFFFIGVKINYIDFYEIKEYYNVIFVDQISWKLFGVMALLLGLLFALPKKLYFSGTIFLIVMFLSMATLHDAIGKRAGDRLFSKQKRHIKIGQWTYSGTLLYEGRNHLYLLSDEYNKTLTFQKDKIDETY